MLVRALQNLEQMKLTLQVILDVVNLTITDGLVCLFFFFLCQKVIILLHACTDGGGHYSDEGKGREGEAGGGSGAWQLTTRLALEDHGEGEFDNGGIFSGVPEAHSPNDDACTGSFRPEQLVNAAGQEYPARVAVVLVTPFVFPSRC